MLASDCATHATASSARHATTSATGKVHDPGSKYRQASKRKFRSPLAPPAAPGAGEIAWRSGSTTTHILRHYCLSPRLHAPIPGVGHRPDSTEVQVERAGRRHFTWIFRLPCPENSRMRTLSPRPTTRPQTPCPAEKLSYAPIFSDGARLPESIVEIEIEASSPRSRPMCRPPCATVTFAGSP